MFVLCGGRFLPDKAIDLIDEAGSHVRLQHAQLPEEAKELDKEVRKIIKEKEEFVRNQDFEKVDVRNRPVIGLRLQLEGIRSNRLAIHLQHLTSLPKSLPLADNTNAYLACDSYSCNFHKEVKWSCFFHIFVLRLLNPTMVSPLSRELNYKLKRSVSFHDCASSKLLVPRFRNHQSGINPPILAVSATSLKAS